MKQRSAYFDPVTARRVVICIVMLVFSFVGLCAPVCALVAEQGEFGNGFVWALDEEGVFTINGTGDLPSFPEGERPWEACTERITEVVFSEGLTNTGAFYFKDCANLISVQIPETVLEISSGCFLNCTSLASVELPEKLLRVGDTAFCGCHSLKELTVPEKVEEVGYNAFGYDERQTLLHVVKRSAAHDYAVENGLHYLTYEGGPSFSDDVLPLILVFALAATVIAKIISCLRHENGRMGKAYKKRFKLNRSMYFVFGFLVCCFAASVSAQNNYLYVVSIPEKLIKIVSVVFAAIFVVFGAVWLLTEVIRKDFPWGIFRVIERFFYMGIAAAGSYLLMGVIVGLIGDKLMYLLQIILLLLDAFGTFMGVRLVVNSLEDFCWFLAYRDPEERAQARRESERAAWEALQKKYPSNNKFSWSAWLPDTSSEPESRQEREVKVWRQNGLMKDYLKVSSDGERYFDPKDGEWHRIK